MTIHTDLARLQAEYAALTNLDPNLQTEEITRARESLHRRIGNTRAVVADMAARETAAELHNRMRPPPEPAPPPPQLDAHGRPIPPPPPTFKSAREQFEFLKNTNPLQAAQFASRYSTDIFGR